MLLTAVAGIILVSLPPLGWWSYDVSYLARRQVGGSVQITNAAIIYADEVALKTFGDGRKVDWRHHAQLLDYLTKDGARVVLYDFVFNATNPVPALNQTLAQAIQRQGSVVLITPKIERERVELLEPPVSPLDEAACGSGHGELYSPAGRLRLVPPDYLGVKYAGWVAAAHCDSNRFSTLNSNQERWLNYYGPPPELALPAYHFEDVLSNAVPAGTFAQKIVVVGGRSSTSDIGNLKETFATPYGMSTYKLVPGAAIHATALLNLVRGDWLLQLSRGGQYLIVTLCGFGVTGLLYALSRRGNLLLVATAVLSGLLIAFISLWFQWHHHVWWSWLVGAVCQPAMALGYVWFHRRANPYVAFISYRMEDDGAAALLIARGLSERGQKVFIDVRSLESGRFDEQLLREIESATYFVLILSPKSLARCVNADDWVLKELTHALAKGKPIIPVFRGGFNFDAKEEVPDLPQIRELRNYQGVMYSGSDFDGFLQRLSKLLR